MLAKAVTQQRTFGSAVKKNQTTKRRTQAISDALSGDFRNFVIPQPAANDIDIDWDNPQWLEAGLRCRLSNESGPLTSGEVTQ